MIVVANRTDSEQFISYGTFIENGTFSDMENSDIPILMNMRRKLKTFEKRLCDIYSNIIGNK